MIDGVANLMAFPYGLLGTGAWRDERGMNTFDGGAPWYGVYQTADRQYMAVGAVEEPFYANLLLGLGLDASSLPRRTECPSWPLIRQTIATAFLRRTRAQWEQVFEALDACVTPMLSMREAPQHPHMMARGVFAVVNGVTQPVPAPRVVGGVHGGVDERNQPLEDVLLRWRSKGAGSQERSTE